MVTDCMFSRNSVKRNGGGGMSNVGGSPTVINCTFEENTTSESSGDFQGGGMENLGSNSIVANCTFNGNYSNDMGGGTFNWLSSPTVTNCTFKGNSARYRGGGMYNDKSNPTVTNCTFSMNSAVRHDGGGMFNLNANPMVTNCTFIGNSAGWRGGGIINTHESSAVLTNCTFSRNSALNGEALACNYQQYIYGPSNIQVSNCILWNGANGIWKNEPSTITITYSDIQGGWPGEGNINTSPFFIDIANDDYHLLRSSPCINAGDNTAVPFDTADLDGDGDINEPVPFDLDSNPRITGERVDIGAYEYELLNTPPVADVGDDQAITELGSTVQLDGSQSWDDDGDAITYFWTISDKPEGSLAELSNPCAVDPNFIADVHGDYVVTLVVTDIFGAESLPDSMTVSFENVEPVADAGDNQPAIVGDIIFLDGSGSYDGNGDLLSYSWSFVSKPSESLAELSDANVVNPSFIADKAGAYVVSLVVNDGFVDSKPANVTIMAIFTQEAAALALIETIETINALDPESFKNNDLGDALTNKINAALEMIDQGLYQDALNKVEKGILQKTNGCAESIPPAPDKNDWIISCPEQDQVYLLIIEAIELLEALI